MLQAAHSNYQIRAFENFHELVEEMLIVLRPGPKVFFQYELRFVNRLKSQLLISHLFFPIKEMPSGREKEARNQAAFWEISPPFLDCSINFYFNVEPRARSRRFPGSILLPKFLGIFEWPRARAGAFREGPLLAALFGSGAVSDLSQQVARMSAAICGFLISADVVNLAPHISTNPEWQLAIDQDPQMAVETRRVIFDRTGADKLTISRTHWLMPNVGTLAKDGNSYVFAAEG